MKNINNITLHIILVCIILFPGCDKKTNSNNTTSTKLTTDTQEIEITEVFSRIITRNKADRVYSGQIKSESGLTEFEKTYEVVIEDIAINFKKQMLIFGITDDISTRVFRFLHNKKKRSFTLDYTNTGIQYKLKPPSQGKKHSYLQVFTLKKTNGIPHIEVKNLIRNGLSKVYDK